MSDPMASDGSISDIRRATVHLDSDALSSKLHSRKLQPLDVAADRESADPSGRASETPSANTESESVNSLTEDDDKLQRMAAACRTLIECLGEDPSREGLLKTPMRMAKALVACTAGYSQDPASIVSDALFECDSDDLVVVRDISCYSMCEHHMLPFMGKVHIGYLPQGKVVGLSKLARLTDCFSKRLQIQERLTRQIAEAVRDVTGAAGVAVMCEASHMCMTMRGVEKPGSCTQSVCYLGAFKEGEGARDLRQEFNAAVRGGGGGSPVGR